MKTTINEDNLKTIISESIIKILNESMFNDGDNVVATYNYFSDRLMSFANMLKNAGEVVENFISRLSDRLKNNGIVVNGVKEEFDEDELNVYFSVNNLNNVKIPENYQDTNLKYSVDNMLEDICYVEYRDEKMVIKFVEGHLINETTIMVTVTFNDSFNPSFLRQFDF